MPVLFLTISQMLKKKKNRSGFLNYKLHNNYPNPFKPTTIIEFNIPKSSIVSLEIFDILGRKITKIIRIYSYGIIRETIKEQKFSILQKPFLKGG